MAFPTLAKKPENLDPQKSLEVRKAQVNLLWTVLPPTNIVIDDIGGANRIIIRDA